MPKELNHHHQDTLEKIFRHPVGTNIDWDKVTSLLEEVGTTTVEHNGNLKVTIGSETEVFHRPSGKDIDKQMVVDLKRMLTGAGFAPGE